MKVIFYVEHLYYLPQYFPVWDKLTEHQATCLFVFKKMLQMEDVLFSVSKNEKLPILWVMDNNEAVEIFQKEKADWIIFGNNFDLLDQIPDSTKTAMLYHGIGVKDCYYDKNLMETDVRFTEGEYRFKQLKKRHPEASIEKTGFAKLDPLSLKKPEKKNWFNLEKAGLDIQKSTLLYAPTFYPSSIELIPDEWPYEFNEYNIIIKPHFFTLSKSKYKKQKKIIETWANCDNVYFAGPEDYSLLPFMAVSDLLISEASAAFFEFAALGKPVIWCDFLKLRWTYRGPLYFRYKKRMDKDIEKYSDIGVHVKKYKDLKKAVVSQIKNPDEFSNKRKQYSNEIVGTVDGKASERIVDYLMRNK